MTITCTPEELTALVRQTQERPAKTTLKIDEPISGLSRDLLASQAQPES